MIRSTLSLLLLAAVLSGLAPAQGLIDWRQRTGWRSASFPAETSRWEMDIAGGIVADQVGANDCTAVGSPLDTTEGIDFESTSSQYLDCGNVLDGSFDDTPVTICGVFHVESDFTGTLAGRYNGSGTPLGYAIQRWGPSDKLLANVREGGQSMLVSATSPLLAAGSWYHGCASFETSPTVAETVLTINGTATSKDSLSDGFTNADASAPAEKFAIAADGLSGTPGRFWDGQIGIIRIWYGTWLSASQQAAVCNADKTIMSGRGVTVTCD